MFTNTFFPRKWICVFELSSTDLFSFYSEIIAPYTVKIQKCTFKSQLLKKHAYTYITICKNELCCTQICRIRRRIVRVAQMSPGEAREVALLEAADLREEVAPGAAPLTRGREVVVGEVAQQEGGCVGERSSRQNSLRCLCSYCMCIFEVFLSTQLVIKLL